MRRDEILKALNITILLTIINVVMGVLWIFVDNTSLISLTATGFGFLEFAIFLIVGACLMARDPLNEEDRLDEFGMPTRGYKMVLFGRVLMISAMLLFLIMGLLFVLGSLFNF